MAVTVIVMVIVIMNMMAIVIMIVIVIVIMNMMAIVIMIMIMIVIVIVIVIMGAAVAVTQIANVIVASVFDASLNKQAAGDAPGAAAGFMPAFAAVALMAAALFGWAAAMRVREARNFGEGICHLTPAGAAAARASGPARGRWPPGAARGEAARSKAADWGPGDGDGLQGGPRKSFRRPGGGLEKPGNESPALRVLEIKF
jgi:hypothetical protein